MKPRFNLLNKKPSGICPLLLLFAILSCVQSGCVFFHGQQYYHFTTRTPLNNQDILVLGFLGGRESWNNDKRNVRKLALKLRALNLPHVHTETVENKKRDL